MQEDNKKEMMKALDLDEKCSVLERKVEEKEKRIGELEAEVVVTRKKAVITSGFTRNVLEVVKKYGTGVKGEV